MPTPRPLLPPSGTAAAGRAVAGPHHRPHRLRRLARGWGLVACLGLPLVAPAQASPEGAVDARAGEGAAAPTIGDPLLRMLELRGVLPPVEALEAPALALRQARDATSELVIAAMNFVGVRYQRGGSSAERGFDCSGFTRHVVEHSLGLVLPRRAEQQARSAGLGEVARTELRPGDLVFFDTMRRAFSHVGIYIGDGKFIHAPRSGAQVRVEDMGGGYWTRRFNGARRLDVAPAPASAAQASPRH